ncbi:MAG: hypothetical protein V1707_03205 [bacterium]
MNRNKGRRLPIASRWGERLFGRKRYEVLKAVVREADRWFAAETIARRIGLPASTVKRELKFLTDCGAVIKEHLATEIWYQLSAKQPMARLLVELTTAVHLAEQAERLKVLASDQDVKLLVLTGRLAAGSQAVTDVLVVGNNVRQWWPKAFEREVKKGDFDLRYTLMTPRELKARQAATDKFLYEIMAGPKIVVVDRLTSGG